MRLLVTGATGFIGRTIVMRALGDDRITEVVAPVRSPAKLRQQLAREGFADQPKLSIVEAEAPAWDLRNLGSFDRVVHCAGVLFSRSREEYFRVNVEGTVRLLETVGGNPRVVVLSSQAAGGPTPRGQEAKKLTDPDRPVSWYGASKLRMELAVRENPPDFPVLLLRAPMVLGPGDQATLPLFRMVRGKVWPKPGLRAKHYSWISSGDLADAIAAWFERGPQHGLHTSYVASGSVISDSDLMLTAAKISGRRGLLLPVPQIFLRPVALASKFIPAIGQKVPSLTPDRAREIWPDRWVVDASDFREATGWSCRDTLEESLARTLVWFRREGLV
ncbi:MAG: NAD(P)-dependent oxidoreductase [Chthoniobacterales bacterium]|nr:NAD(P)-dependent oxidoreductase [Chthoniobacterales bacterium]